MTSLKRDETIINKSADYVRYLALECIEKAKSGHPGLPLGCANLGILLYRYILKYNTEVPSWVNRDRFILSAGHGSMLLYSLLHLAGYNLSLEDLNQFRQLGSKTPGHPEYEIHLGIETTTGPLGQGIANAVGCAIEGKMLAQRFNKPEKGFDLFNYTVYTLLGDGCNMEGISYEAGSMAGHLGLDNLVAIYDSNSISIDGRTSITFTEDVGKRYEALGWYVEHADILNLEDVFVKLERLKNMREGKPKLLIVKTTIGEGILEKKDKPDIHGAPAGTKEIVYFIQHSTIRDLFEAKYGKETVADETKLSEIIQQRMKNKEALIDAPACNDFMKIGAEEGKKAFNLWSQKLDEYRNAFPEDYKSYESFMKVGITDLLRERLLNYKEEKTDATRNVMGKLLNICGEMMPQIVGGCADLAGSTKAILGKSTYIKKDDFSGRNIAYGVREHVMGAIGNGLALNKTLIPYSSTFFTFFDYMKPAVRLSALMKLNHLFLFTHDSIYVGEDGPTHQPIEHLNAMRLIPGIYAFRPANDIETAFAYLYFLKRMNGPVAIIATRQKVSDTVFIDFKDREKLFSQFEKGAYVFYETKPGEKPEIILAGSGSELSTAMETAKLLEEKQKKNVRVVSIPCLELFSEAGPDYKDEIFIPGIPVVMIEAGSHRGVKLFYDPRIQIIDIDTFGLSAPDIKLSEYFGFHSEKICEKIKIQ